MPIDTNLNVPPYYNDYNPDKQYYRVLFKPSTALQVRELNSLQDMHQYQIEKFGDNIFKNGTIISGCNFSFYNIYPYVKILDNQVDGEPVVPNDYVGFLAKNSSNLTAYIVNDKLGFESQDPDLNTLYLRYTNSGANLTQTAFSPAEILTIADANNSVRSVTITNGGSGFANSDPVVFVPALVVDVSSSNTFANGETITQSTTGANAVIISVNNTISSQYLVLNIKPKVSDLGNTLGNSSIWTFETGYNITSNTTSTVANVVSIFGANANAVIVTDNFGQIQDIAMTNFGFGYNVPPYVSVKPSSNSASLNDLSLDAKNYLCQVTVASVANSTGSGYAFGVSDGVIYQKGTFLKVDAQTIVVDKYDTFPDQVSIGFSSVESVVNSFSDSSLLDNVNSSNKNAPGADRLKIVPTLVVQASANAASNDEFFPIVEFSNGSPYKQNQITAYNSIQDEIDTRTYETSGNFVIDPFQLATTSPSNNAYESNTFTLVIDPGLAYINGSRVKTTQNYYLNCPKGLDTLVVNNYLTINYGNYITVNELGGIFQFDTGDVVSLRDTAKLFVSNTENIGTTITAAGTEIGKARIRSLVYNSGVPGSNSAYYNLYLFDISMNSGKNFRNVSSIYYTNVSGRTAIADVVKSYDASTNTNIAVLQGISNNSLLFAPPDESLKNANNVTFTYRNISNSAANTSGLITISLVPTQETFPYSETLPSTELLDLVVIPLANGISNLEIANTTTVTNATATVTSGNNFLTYLMAGDYIKITEGVNTSINQVKVVSNNTNLQLTTNSSINSTNATIHLVFPQNIPVSLTRTGRSANVDVTGKTLTVNLGANLTSNTDFNTIHNIKSSASQSSKTVNRNIYTKLNLANNSDGISGPWNLGLPDVFRLKGVWMNSNVANITESNTNVTNEFYIDHNQNANYYGLSYLYLKPTSKLTLANTNALLVKFDAFTYSTKDYFTIASYSLDDSSNTIFDSNTTINIQEIPEVFSDNGDYYDLINCFDFRPLVANTGAISNTISGATINPVEPSYASKFGNTADSTNSLVFPSPTSNLSATVEKYLSRADRVVVTADGNITSIQGKSAVINPAVPPAPANAITLGTVSVPPYPSYPLIKSANLISIFDKSIANQKYSYKREQDHTISFIANSAANDASTMQTITYTMADIANLERRISVLEYYNSLNLLEKQVSGVTIPSSIDPSIDRFKYGFFADDFTTLSYSDVNNPEYKAAIVNNFVVPSQNSIQIDYTYNSLHSNTVTDAAGDILTFAFTPTTLIQQLNATDGAVVVPVQNVVSNTVTTTSNTVANTANTTPPPPADPPAPDYPIHIYVNNELTYVSNNYQLVINLEGNANYYAYRTIYYDTTTGITNLYLTRTGGLDIAGYTGTIFTPNGIIPKVQVLNSLDLAVRYIPLLGLEWGAPTQSVGITGVPVGIHPQIQAVP